MTIRKTFSVSVSVDAEIVIDVRQTRASAVVDKDGGSPVAVHRLSHMQAITLLTDLSEAITTARAQLGKSREVHLSDPVDRSCATCGARVPPGWRRCVACFHLAIARSCQVRSS